MQYDVRDAHIDQLEDQQVSAEILQKLYNEAMIRIAELEHLQCPKLNRHGKSCGELRGHANECVSWLQRA